MRVETQLVYALTQVLVQSGSLELKQSECGVEFWTRLQPKLESGSRCEKQVVASAYEDTIYVGSSLKT